MSYNALQAKHYAEGGINKPHRTLNITLKAPVVELEMVSYADLT